MEKIKGVNLGNWLVLEQWMQPEFFEGTGAEDEIWLNRKVPLDVLALKMKVHRDTYVTEEDFKKIAAHGLNMVRIPVPYFVFGDRAPLIGCIEYLDKAFDWAEAYGLKILIDLHTVDGSQNSYDNGGLTGVCKWCQNPREVRFALSVLERLSKRYADREGLFGIEVLNEPISFSVYMTAPSRTKAVDKEEAKGSAYVPMGFLKGFYQAAYKRMRRYLPEEKAIIFHDGFRLSKWGDFFVKSGMKNVMLDTHIYIFAMESFVPIHKMWVYDLYMKFNAYVLAKAQKYTPVIVGEWCISNRYAVSAKEEAKKAERFRKVAQLQLKTWESTAGYFYWNYQLGRDISKPMDEEWKESWALNRCWEKGWISL